MSDTTPGPDHRADEPEGLVAYAELAEPAAPEFLPLSVRRVLYIIALLGTVAAPIVAVTDPEYAAAILTGSTGLNLAALGVALANPKGKA